MTTATLGTTPKVSEAFAALVERHDARWRAANDGPNGPSQSDGEMMREVLHEQLRDAVTAFAQLADPLGTRIVSANGIAPLFAFEALSNIPVLDDDIEEAKELLADEVRAMAKLPEGLIYGAALTERPNGEISVRPLMAMKVFS